MKLTAIKTRVLIPDAGPTFHEAIGTTGYFVSHSLKLIKPVVPLMCTVYTSSASFSIHPSIFQAEVYAIERYVEDNLDRNNNDDQDIAYDHVR